MSDGIHKLTRDDLKALRTCDDVSFMTRFGESADGGICHVAEESHVTCTKRVQDVWRTEVTHTIPTMSRLQVYGKRVPRGDMTDGRYDRYQARSSRVTCYGSVSSCRYDDQWRTIVGLLRAGDALEFEWIGGNDNGYLNQAGLHRDELRLHVYRGDKGKRLSFLIDASTSPNNTARMLQGVYYELIESADSQVQAVA